MANTTIKITQLPSIGNGLSANTILPVVNTTGTAITAKVVVGNVANFILTEAGNLLPPALVSTIAYSVANSAQPNITSVGTLSVNTLKISGGTNGYFLQTNGNGNLAWVAGGGSGNGVVGGSNTQIQFNNAGNFAGDPELTWDAGNNRLITSNLSISGNANVGTVNTANVNATGNLKSNAIYTDNYFYANGYVFGGGGNGTPGGANTQVQFNNNGTFAGEGNFTYDSGNHILSVTRANVSYLTAYTSITGGNSVTANFFIGSGANLTNIAGGNVSGFVPNANVANTAFAVAAANVIGLGNIATLSLSGSSSNVLYGNGVFAAVAGGANTGNVTFNNINIIGTGNLHLQPDPANANSGSYLDIFLTSGPDIHLVASANANLILGKDNGANVMTSWDGNAYIQAWDGSNASIWTFGQDGSTIFPTLTVQRGDNPSGTITGQTLSFGDPSQEAIISTADGTVSNENSQRLVINPGQGYDYGEGGDIYLWAGRGGDGSGSGGDIKIRGGQGGANTTGGIGGSGGYIRIEAGDSATTGGSPGYVDINGGNSAIAGGGYVEIYGGQGATVGGDANLKGGYGYNDRGGNVNIWGGGSANGQANEGNVNIQTGGNTWTFDPSGNLTLPNGGSIYSLSSTPSGNPGNTIILQPAGSGVTTNQQLLVYPTAGDGDHIHLTSGNLYQTELFLGSDSLFIKLANTGNVVINSNDSNGNSAMWTFDTTGNLTLPGNLVINGFTNVFGSNIALLESNPDLPLLSISSGSNGGASSIWAEDIGNIGTSNIAAVYTNPTPGSGIVRIAVGQNGGNTGPNLWDFNANGTITLPALSGQIGISGYTNGIDLYNNNGGSGYVRMNYADESFVWADSGGAHVQTTGGTWDFDTDGILTLPNGALIKDTVNAAVAFGDGAGANTQGAYSVSVGPGTGANTQGTYAVAVGSDAGANTQGNLAVAVGYNAGNATQGLQAVAVGAGAGQNTQGNNSVAIGYSAGVNTQGEASIAIGQNAGNTTQGNSAVAIGVYAGQTNQGDDTVAIGDSAGQTGQKEDAVAIGRDAGSNAQGNSSVAIGYSAGSNNQGNQSVAIGENAGVNQGSTAVAIGQNAGGGVAYQNDDAVAIGHSAGEEDQGTQAIAIGLYTGQVSQGLNSIALGAYAGQTNQGNNSIILNATGSNLDQTTANTFTVSPIRNDTSNANIAEVMFYNTTSKEVTYGNSISVAGNVTANNFTGNGGSLSNVATKTTGSWTLAPGVNTVNLSVPTNGTYSIWVNGNIPNGIVTYTATAVVTNTNVPVLGSSYGWYYAAGNALVLTSIPTQFVGTVNNISNAVVSTTTANVFTFGITNNSGNTAVVNWGYTKL